MGTDLNGRKTEVYCNRCGKLLHPKRGRQKKRRPRNPRITDPVERVSVPFPHRRKYFHRNAPDVIRSLKATRHDRDVVKQIIRQKQEPKIYLRANKVTLKPIRRMR